MKDYFMVYRPQNDRVSGIMLGFADAGGEHKIVTAQNMVPRSRAGRLSAVLRAVPAFFTVPSRTQETRPAGPIARLRHERLFQRFAAYFRENPGAIFLVWNGTKGVRKIAAAAAKSVGTEVVYMELAPMPKRIAIDRQGVNYGSSFPRDAAFFRAWAASMAQNEDWRDARYQIAARALRRPPGDEQQQARIDELPERYIFCPLQVPGDSQITEYGGWIRSIEHLIDKIAQAAKHVPEGWGVVVKQHPSSPIDFRSKGLFRETVLINGDAIGTVDLIKRSSLVVTVNSSVGLEASLFDKPVVVLGQAIYGVDGFCWFAPNAKALRTIFETPESIDFDPALRAALIGYMQQEYLFEEADVVAGKIALSDILARDRCAETISARP